MPTILESKIAKYTAVAGDYKRRKREHEEKVARITRERLELYFRCAENIELQAIAIAKCSRDPIYFINYFVTTYDPRLEISVIPFILFTKQEECVLWLLERLEKQEWGGVVKCRDTGLSWLVCALFVWLLLFKKDFACTLASNKASQVDKKHDRKCLFEKVVMMLRFLPKWMHDINLKRDRTNMLIVNPYLNSSISGESGDQIGRGGRSGVAACDEFGFIEQDKAAIAALSRNTDCAFFVSTPNGTDTEFFDLFDKDRIPFFHFPWYADPRRSPKWRAEQDIKLGEDIAAQELDCDFYAAVQGVYIKPKWILTCVDAHLQIPELTTTGARQAGLDIGATSDASVITIKDGSIVTDLIELDLTEPTQTAINAHNEINDRDIAFLTYDADGLGRDVDGALDLLVTEQNYSVIRFHGSGATSNKYWEEHEKHSKELFLNKRAEAWGYARWKILNTYNHLLGIEKHTPEEMVSIPNNKQLINDLSKPKRQYRGSKIKLESKEEMKSRGLASPNHGDSFVYACYDLETPNWLRYS